MMIKPDLDSTLMRPRRYVSRAGIPASGRRVVVAALDDDARRREWAWGSCGRVTLAGGATLHPEVPCVADPSSGVVLLEEMPHPVPVEGPGVAREEGTHDPSERARAGPAHPVGMIREERPGVDGPRSRLGESSEAPDKLAPVGVVGEDGCPLDSPHHHMVQGARRIEAGLARHGISAA